jgi:S1-C subfamily serine protease
MEDNDSGSEQQSGWQPPEYVSPWIAQPGGAASSSPSDGEPAGEAAEEGSDTISFGQQGDTQPPAYGGHPQHGYGPPPGYGQPGHGQSGYGQPGYGPPPGYGQSEYGQGGGYGQPWGYGYGTPPPPEGSRFGKFLAYVAVAVLAAGAGAGAAIALNNSSAPAGSTASPNFGGGANPFGNGNGNGGGFPGNGGASGSGSLNVQSLENKVDPAVVDVTSQLKYQDATAEGTGMVISSDGLVLTNNHVIDQATSVSAQLVESGRTYTAKVLGYDSTDDVALLQLVGASGLKTVSLGDSSSVKIGDSVLALGNAGGRGGLPSTAQGVINGTGRTIQASDQGANTTETLHNMLQTNAPIQEGDSGGPLVNSSGQVIGMDTAANSSQGVGDATTAGFAIPINGAETIARQIASGHANSTVHIGLAGFIGIDVADVGSSNGCGAGGGGTGNGGLGGEGGANGAGGVAPVSSGALVCQVFTGAPAQTAGLSNGDVITSIDGHSVTSANSLTSLMAGDHPGDRLSVGYVDVSGARHTTAVTLTEWAK